MFYGAQKKRGESEEGLFYKFDNELLEEEMGTF